MGMKNFAGQSAGIIIILLCYTFYFQGGDLQYTVHRAAEPYLRYESLIITGLKVGVSGSPLSRSYGSLVVLFVFIAANRCSTSISIVVL